MKRRFTPADQRRIDAAVAAVEQATAADLDLMVVQASDRYSLYPLVWAGTGALIVAGLAALLSSSLNGRLTIMVELAALIVLIPLFDWMPVRLWLVPQRVRHAHARQLAHREFDAHFTAGKAPGNRILLFVSLGDRYVEIIADRETHARIPAGVWNAVVADFVAAVRSGQLTSGLLAAIDSCGAMLQAHYPESPSG